MKNFRKIFKKNKRQVTTSQLFEFTKMENYITFHIYSRKISSNIMFTDLVYLHKDLDNFQEIYDKIQNNPKKWWKITLQKDNFANRNKMCIVKLEDPPVYVLKDIIKSVKKSDIHKDFDEIIFQHTPRNIPFLIPYNKNSISSQKEYTFEYIDGVGMNAYYIIDFK